MADLTVTATTVVPLTDARILQGIAGEAITAGQSLYVKAADSKLWKAQCDGTVEEATCAGIALNGAAANQTVAYIEGGSLNIGATTSKATTYVVSATAGGIAPQADLIATNRISYVGYATDTTGTLVLNRRLTGAVV
jgi:hypothetical protein